MGENSKNKSLMIVSTPLQVLCAISAIEHFGIGKYDLIFFSANSQCERINKRGIDILLFFDIPFKRMILSKTKILSFLMRESTRYSDIYVGDYFFEHQALFAAVSANKNAKITFLDDGNSSYLITLKSATSLLFKKEAFAKRFFLRFLIEILYVLKNISHTNLYTFFNVKECEGWRIASNNFECFRYTTNKKQEGVFIIGTTVSIFPNGDEDYMKYLSAVNDYCRMKYPRELIFYCPHRTSNFDKEHADFIAALNLDIFNTEYTIEFDFFKKNINPHFVIGFASSALYSLKKIYPKSTVESVLFESNRKYRKEYLLIQEYYAPLIKFIKIV